jgi:hypothetical protein
MSDGSFKVEPVEVLANDEHHGPEGWRKATFLPDDLAAFDRFFTP